MHSSLSLWKIYKTGLSLPFYLIAYWFVLFKSKAVPFIFFPFIFINWRLITLQYWFMSMYGKAVPFKITDLIWKTLVTIYVHLQYLLESFTDIPLIKPQCKWIISKRKDHVALAVGLGYLWIICLEGWSFFSSLLPECNCVSLTA